MSRFALLVLVALFAAACDKGGRDAAAPPETPAGGASQPAAGASAEQPPQPSIPSQAQQAAPPAPPPDAAANLPPLPMPDFPLPRLESEVRLAYEFAALHPEVLRYVPCYCGCERTGHQHNESCFVASRDADGRVLRWDTHGMG